MPKAMTLEGSRLRLRPWQPADLAPMAALNADPVAMRHFAAPMARATSNAWVAKLQRHIETHGWGFWAVERREASGSIGAVGLLTIPWQATADTPEGGLPIGQGTPSAVEIGWRIANAFQRQGYAEEAARLALAAGFGPLALPEIVAFTVEANAPSWRLMEKLGMMRAGHFLHPSLPEGHALQAHLLFRVTRAGWLHSVATGV